MTEVQTDVLCYHCGQVCEETHHFDNKEFCCYGCKTVYEILQSNNLCEYYALDDKAGTKVTQAEHDAFAYLDEPHVRKQLLTFDSTDFARVTFFVPSVHCISCIWLMENLQKLNGGVVKSEVNFPKKQVTIDFNPTKVQLSTLASLSATLGYAPQINLESNTSTKPRDNKLVLKLAMAGFCFGNVMLFSFPEYLGLDTRDQLLMRIFSGLNWLLSVPVFFYSGFDYFRSAWQGLKLRQLTIEVPIALGLLALFGRSTYDIMTHTGPGYLDSFTGLVFFLLIGRWFQGKTYESLAFDRDFKSYFPLAVQKKTVDRFSPVIIYNLEKGDELRIRNMEIIPADSRLISGTAYIDYSFVTGEAKPVRVAQGELIYAGGRLIGEPAHVVVEKKTSQSHLTSLWNHDAFRKIEESKYKKIIDNAARRFTWIVLGIAVITAFYWQINQPHQMWLVLTAVLMVACPCALALAAPFTYGNMLREFGRHGLYLKNADVIERMGTIDGVVFDKTGTVTHGKRPEVFFHGELTENEEASVRLLTSYSTHPLSKIVHDALTLRPCTMQVENFKELPGQGIEARVNGVAIRIGSRIFTSAVSTSQQTTSAEVHVSINGNYRGYFEIRTSVREHLKDMLDRLGKKSVALLSGDNEADKTQMGALFNPAVQLLFNQNPHDKLHFIKSQQQSGKRIMMMGDGLNDAGALKQSDVGIAVTDDTGVFTPACDGILVGQKLQHLDQFIELAQSSSRILKIAFGISFFYNAIALAFAVSGHLTPLVAAILMPISSISVVGFSSLAVQFVSKRKLKS